MRLLLSLLLILPLAGQAQHKEEITASFNEYFAFTEQGDFMKTLDYMPDELFDLVPREQMEMVMKQTFENPEFAISMDQGKIHGISDEVVHEDIRYATVDYQYHMRFTFKAESDPQMMAAIKQYLEAQAGAENVTVNEDEHFVEAVKNSTMYVIKKPGQDWKFLEKTPEMQQVLGQIIPTEVTEKL